MLSQLALDAATTFILDSQSRILRENDPDGSPGPRFFLSRCAQGALTFVRHDVSAEIATALGLLALRAPFPSAEAAALLAREAPVVSTTASLIYALPHAPHSALAGFVFSGAADGAQLLAQMQSNGVPRHLADAGFLSTADFWEPWIVAQVEGEIAAMAFTARLSAAGAAVGVYTFPAYRRRGLAAAVTEAWSALPDLRPRTLFYSHDADNSSSRRVTERLGLSRIGEGLRIT